MTKLETLLERAAELCEAEGLPIDGEPGGAIQQWVWRNCAVPVEAQFYVVTLICAEMADRRAQREGYENQAHRAACKEFDKVYG